MVNTASNLNFVNIPFYKKNDIAIVSVKNAEEGLVAAKKIIYHVVDKNTAFFLSGGISPKSLYEDLAKEKRLLPGIVAVVDERFGMPFHKNSNEKMIKVTGLIDYLEANGIRFEKVLKTDERSTNNSLENTAFIYNKKVQDILLRFQTKVAIMGIGGDGHTASLPAGGQRSRVKGQNYVVSISDFSGEFKERVT